MPLPSQSARISNLRSGSSRKMQSLGVGRKSLLTAGVIGLFIAAWLWFTGGEAAHSPRADGGGLQEPAPRAATSVATSSLSPAGPHTTPSDKKPALNGLPISKNESQPTANQALAVLEPILPTTTPPNDSRADEHRPPPSVPTTGNNETPVTIVGETTTTAALQQPQAKPSAQVHSNSNVPNVDRLQSPAVRSTGHIVQHGKDLIRNNQPVEARRVLTNALDLTGLADADADEVRLILAEINSQLVFSPVVTPGDPYASKYRIQSGDSLAKLPRKLGLAIDWRILQRINNISRPERIRVDQEIKIITGPFHAVVEKNAYRMDILMGDGSDRVFVCSLPVGLGELNSTPVGIFKVRRDSKLINPAWTNPRTGERFAADDPKNPIGERWIGLEGISENIRGLTGYGIHGTIEPNSIGKQLSMGCVRLNEPDVELVYELLTENASIIEIR